MTRKEEKRLEQRKSTIKSCAIAYVFGIAMLVLGIVGIISGNRDLREYQNSPDVRYVDALVTYASIHKDKPLPNERPEYYWDAELSFSVDGTEYEAKDRFYKEVKKGDTVRIEVYQAGDGSYKIPTVKSETGNTLKKLLMYAALAVGAVVTIAATVVLADGLKKGKKPAGGKQA